MNKYSVLVCVLLCACYRPYSKMNAHQQAEIKQQIGEFKLSNLNDDINALYSINGQNIDDVLEQLEINERLAIVFFFFLLSLLRGTKRKNQIYTFRKSKYQTYLHYIIRLGILWSLQ